MTSLGTLRLVVYTDADSREIGGAELSLGNLLEALSDDVEATVLGVDASIVEQLASRRPSTGREVVAPVRGKSDVAAMTAHVHAVRRLRPDVFHASLSNLVACRYGILAALVTRGVRVVAVEQSPQPVASSFQLRTKRALSRRLDAHVAVGERSARATEELLRLPQGSMRTIHNGVPELAPGPPPSLGPGPVVGAIGRLSAEKGFDVLVRALPHLPTTTAVVVGEGEERGRLVALAGELGVADRLVLTGWRDNARAYLGAFDVLALPSRFEGFPLVVSEAMLAGVPVVASDVGSIAEAVNPGETGLLVPPDAPEELATALASLLADGDRRRTFGDRGREVARARFTASVMAARFEQLYDELRT